MIRTKVNPVDTQKELRIAQEYINRYKYIILNEFVNHMRLNYRLSYTYERATELLHSMGFERRRIAFEDEFGIKQSKNEFINENGLNKNKPVVLKSRKKEYVIEVIISRILNFIKDNFFEISYKNGIYNFNLYNSDEGVILLFDNKSLKSVLKEIEDHFSYDIKEIPMIASKIRKISEQSFIRENNYNETSIRVEDKRFYKYLYKGDIENE
jgi:hypothetical protein